MDRKGAVAESMINVPPRALHVNGGGRVWLYAFVVRVILKMC